MAAWKICWSGRHNSGDDRRCWRRMCGSLLGLLLFHLLPCALCSSADLPSPGMLALLQANPLCKHNITSMCELMQTEILMTCLEYSDLIGLDAVQCQNSGWMFKAYAECLWSCVYCQSIGVMIQQQCQFNLAQFLEDPVLIFDYCAATVYDFVQFRCPSRTNVTLEDCNSDEGEACMSECGVYGDCDCYRSRDDPDGPTFCSGTVVETPDDPMIYQCSTEPKHCQNHFTQGQPCGKYKYCPTNLCLVRDVQCPSPNQCIQDGTCNGHQGWCIFANYPYGRPCDDGIPYTYTDICDQGYCVGTTDYCLLLNVSCVSETPCMAGGVCHPDTGQCTYTQLPDGSFCDDQRANTVEDICEGGLCVGRPTDLCVEQGIVCTTSEVCLDPGVCDPQSGSCSPPTFAPNTPSRSCDDGNSETTNDRCVDGVCLGRVPDSLALFETMGIGECSDRDGLQMSRYSGDVSREEDCKLICREDPQCAAYSYGYPLCSIFGTVRVQAPDGDGRSWSFQLGTTPRGVGIEKALWKGSWQREIICRRRGQVADVEDKTTMASFEVDDFLAPERVAAFFILILGCFFAVPISRAVKRSWTLSADHFDSSEYTKGATSGRRGSQSSTTTEIIAVADVSRPCSDDTKESTNDHLELTDKEHKNQELRMIARESSSSVSNTSVDLDAAQSSWKKPTVDIDAEPEDMQRCISKNSGVGTPMTSPLGTTAGASSLGATPSGQRQVVRKVDIDGTSKKRETPATGAAFSAADAVAIGAVSQAAAAGSSSAPASAMTQMVDAILQ